MKATEGIKLFLLALICGMLFIWCWYTEFRFAQVALVYEKPHQIDRDSQNTHHEWKFYVQF